MKILSLHCDYIKFKPLKKALKEPEEIDEKRKQETNVKEPLVILTAVEKSDENNKEIVNLLVKEIENLFKQINPETIVLYPFAHLSSNLSSPGFALETLKKAEQELLKKKYKVTRAPFGYYKTFELKCKGHPLSELSRSVGGNENDKIFQPMISKDENIDYIENDINNSSKFVCLSLDSQGAKRGNNSVLDYRQLLKEVSKIKLDTSKLKDNDHRIIGKQMDLFSFSEVAPGMVFWHNNGLIIRNKLIEFWREEHRKAGYQEIMTPQILDKKLWLISGHWEKYRDNIFLTEYERKTFAVKPMNCPGGMLIYKNSPKSYKDFPIRAGELGIVHRQELSGVLGGLFRVIQFTQDDAHIFCTEKQLENELIGVIDLIGKFYRLFGFEYRIELSTRPEKRIGTDEIWDKGETILERVLKKKKINFKINKGYGAFYGPKIDFHIKDSLGREWQCGTLQLDFFMPERFELTYKGEDNKEHRPVTLHRTVYGSLERFIGILLEHTNGHLPLWLSPIQIRIINFTDRNNKSCEKLKEELEGLGFRVDIDLTSEPISGKIKQAEIEKIFYIIVIGDKEEKSNSLAVRRNGKVTQIKKDYFIKQIIKEVEEKR